MISERKRIVVTDGTSGIGYSMARTLQSYSEVTVVARNIDKINALTQEFVEFITYHADWSSLETVKVVAHTIIKQFQSIDVLIDSAAVQYTPTLLDDDFRPNVPPLNFTSTYCLSYLLLPFLLYEAKAIILNVNPGIGLAAKSSSAVYFCTKAALNVFSQSLRYQLTETNICVQQAFLNLIDIAMTMDGGKNKMSAKMAAAKIIRGVKFDIIDNAIYKVRILMLRFIPITAKNIMM